MYTAISTNMTGLGGQMGTERTWTNWRANFHDLEKAKSYCEEAYLHHLTESFIATRKNRHGEDEDVARAAATVEARKQFEEKFTWQMHLSDYNQYTYRSPDLGFVQYTIAPIVFSDEPEE